MPDRAGNQDVNSRRTAQAPSQRSSAGEGPRPFEQQQYEYAHPQRTPGPTSRTSSAVSSPAHAETVVGRQGAREAGHVVGALPGPHPQFVQSPSSFSPYGETAGGPLGSWDWNTAGSYGQFGGYFEPQGALAQQLQTQNIQPQDFGVPLPVYSHRRESLPQPTPLQPPVLPSQQSSPATLLRPPPRPSQRPMIQTGMKRKAESEPGSASSAATPSTFDQQANRRATSQSRSSSVSESIEARGESQTAGPSQTQAERRSSANEMTQSAAATATITETAARSADEPSQPQRTTSASKPQDESSSNKEKTVAAAKAARKIPELPVTALSVLPAGKVFPIQIGCDLFRLSGASISSDSPSYFSHFFSEQVHTPASRAGEVRTLYIDRDPATFRDISLHLQGYHIEPRDGEHYVRLFADAQFYSLPRLTQQLFKTDIFIRVGDRDFRIPRDLFSSPGDSPNYFSLGFAHFWSTPSEVFPGLDRTALLRPPSIVPPAVPNKSGQIFGELVQILQGYPAEIRNEDHRAQLLRDARYFHLRGLEQKLIPCDITFNNMRKRLDILIRLEDIRQSGISFSPDNPPQETSSNETGSQRSGSKPATPSSTVDPNVSPSPGPGWVTYARPYVDDNHHELVLEIGAEAMRLDLSSMRTTFTGQTKARISSLFGVIASKMGLPATQPLGLMMLASGGGVAAQPPTPANSGISSERVKVRIGPDAHVVVDGDEVEWRRTDDPSEHMMEEVESRLGKRKRTSATVEPASAGASTAAEDQMPDAEEWIITRGHWRLRVEALPNDPGRLEVVMCAVRLDALTGERARNAKRGFLS